MKAILVIDMPKECFECPCFYDYLHCQAKDGVNVLEDERPYNCPLKPMPEKKKTLDALDDIYAGSGFERGYNACIDEILGEEE